MMRCGVGAFQKLNKPLWLYYAMLVLTTLVGRQAKINIWQGIKTDGILNFLLGLLSKS